MEPSKSKQFQKCPHCGQLVVYKTDYCRLCRKHKETGAVGAPEAVAGPDAPPPQEEQQYKGDARTLGIWCLIVGLVWFGLGIRNWHGGISSKLFTGVFLMCSAAGLLLKYSPRHVCYVILALLFTEGSMCLAALILPLTWILERGFRWVVLYFAAFPISALLVYLHIGMKTLEVLDDYSRLQWRKQRAKPEVVKMRQSNPNRETGPSV